MRNVMPFEVVNDKFAAVFTESTADIFEEETSVQPVEAKKGFRGYVPWGSDNLQPKTILEYLRKSEVMNSNQLFNIQCGYGAGFEYRMRDNTPVIDQKVIDFFDNNNMKYFFLEQFTDMKHFYWTVLELILSVDQKTITNVDHLEAYYTRFETANPKNGKIENIFYANWDDNPKEEAISVIPLLDQKNPFKDLQDKILAGKLKNNKVAMLCKIPIPGRKYYPTPYYWTSFNSGWYDISIQVPTAKKMAMTYGLKVRYVVRIHPNYWDRLFAEEKITEEDAKIARKKTEYTNIKDFLTGYENEGKSWFSGFYVNGKGETEPLVQIEKIDYSKGGEFIEDVEEASNMLCYAQGVHPSLIGATPGKSSGSFSGSDKRELFTMKQALEHFTRDVLLQPIRLVAKFNNWDKTIVFDIPDIMLTTLDKGTDAVKVTTQKQENNVIK